MGRVPESGGANTNAYGDKLDPKQVAALNRWYKSVVDKENKLFAQKKKTVNYRQLLTLTAMHQATLASFAKQLASNRSSPRTLNAWYQKNAGAYGPPVDPTKPAAQQADGDDDDDAAEAAAQDALNRNAADYLKKLFAQYGLTGLDDEILKLVKGGITDPASVTLMLSDTEQYKKRFAANEARKAKGWKVYSPAEYLDLEEQFRKIMVFNGLPTGFYDQNSDFEQWIAGDISPDEINDRIGIANDAVLRKDPQYLDALQKMGLNTGDMVAAALDLKRAFPILKKMTMSAQIGAEANRFGVEWSVDRANYLQGIGVTQDDARQGYGIVAGSLGTAKELGQRYGEQYTQTDLEQDFLVEKGQGPASAKRRRLAGREQSTFTGSTGVTKQSFANKNRGEY
jgi:hypothetical protein